MAIPLTINGVTFQYPQQFDKNWGPTLTNWSSAVTNALIQHSGGLFPLTGELDFGNVAGLKALYLKSESSDLASTGFLRMANATDALVWRNALNSADLALTVNASNQLTFNGIPIGATVSLTNGHIFVGNPSNNPADVAMSGDMTITNTGITTLGSQTVSDSNISNTAAIAFSKLASTSPYYWYVANAAGVLSPVAVTPSRALITDSNGLPSVSGVTPTELSYVSGVTSSIQSQLNAINSSLATNTPVGAMLDFAGVSAPTGWLLCDGSVVSQTTYSNLFTAIGSTWNTGGEGVGNFRLPDMRRRVSVGSGGSGTGTLGNAVGNVGGEENHILSIAELATHTHTASTSLGSLRVNILNTNPGTGSTGDGITDDNYVATADRQLTHSMGVYGASPSTTVDNTGSDTAHNTMQPSAVVTKIIKY